MEEGAGLTKRGPPEEVCQREEHARLDVDGIVTARLASWHGVGAWPVLGRHSLVVGGGLPSDLYQYSPSD